MSEGSKSSANYVNNLIFAERDDVIRGFAFGLVDPAVHFEGDAGVVGSVHDGSGEVGAVLFDGEVFEYVSFGGEVEFLGFGGVGEGEEGQEDG